MAVWAPTQKGIGTAPVFRTVRVVENPSSSSRWVASRAKGKGYCASVCSFSPSARVTKSSPWSTGVNSIPRAKPWRPIS